MPVGKAAPGYEAGEGTAGCEGCTILESSGVAHIVPQSDSGSLCCHQHILEIYLLTTENLNMLTMKVTDNKVPYTVVL